MSSASGWVAPLPLCRTTSRGGSNRVTTSPMTAGLAANTMGRGANEAHHSCSRRRSRRDAGARGHGLCGEHLRGSEHARRDGHGHERPDERLRRDRPQQRLVHDRVEGRRLIDPSTFPTTKKGNPQPGKFPYKTTYTGCVQSSSYTIPLASIPAAPGNTLFVAAHVDLFSTVVNTMDVFSQACQDVYGPLYSYADYTGRRDEHAWVRLAQLRASVQPVPSAGVEPERADLQGDDRVLLADRPQQDGLGGGQRLRDRVRLPGNELGTYFSVVLVS
jgi:hypothetical protein